MLSFAVAFSIIVVFRMFVVERVIVDGNSMSPSFSSGEVLFARKFNINAETVNRFSVVIIQYNGRLKLKRVIGLPNETIQISNGRVIIDGQILQGDYGENIKNYGCAGEEIKLGENEYFVLGDNRNDSTDSRVWGAINISDIKGIVVAKIFPFWE